MTSRTTPRSGDSSSASEAAWQIECRRSRAFAAWRGVVVTLALGGVFASGLPIAARLALAALVLAGALSVFRGPASPHVGRLRRGRDGAWALPDRGLHALRLSGPAEVGPVVVRFRLARRQGPRVSVWVLRDQLGPAEWRDLIAALEQSLAAREAEAHDSSPDSF